MKIHKSIVEITIHIVTAAFNANGAPSACTIAAGNSSEEEKGNYSNTLNKVTSLNTLNSKAVTTITLFACSNLTFKIYMTTIWKYTHAIHEHNFSISKLTVCSI